jgi:hypothetical protein
MTTLRELLDGLDELRREQLCSYRAGRDQRCDCKYKMGEFNPSSEATGCAEMRRALKAIEAWAYGEEEECAECRGSGRIRDPEGGIPFRCPGPHCHGTGTIKTPGLVERVRVATEGRGPNSYGLLLQALSQELGERS